MTREKTASIPDATPDEPWVPMQVAAYLKIGYQDARNAMLEGDFGEPVYDPLKRKLTVLASRVRDAKAQREKSRKRRRSRRKR